MSDKLSMIIGRMTPACRSAITQAASLCVAHGHHEVDVEHVLLAMLDTRGCDVQRILEYFGLRIAAVRTDLDGRLKVFRGGHADTPVFAACIALLFEEAEKLAENEGVGGQIRTGHVLLTLLDRDDWLPMLDRVSPSLASLGAGEVRDFLAALGKDATECRPVGAQTSLTERHSNGSPVPGALERFTIDLTARARAGQLDPVVGREQETLQLVTILCRRRQNNAVLVGDAGVGKTAVVEGLALAIARGEVPPLLQDATLRSLDMGLLQAGASVKGEFEGRLRDILSEIQASSHPIILFVDEAHTLIGAGGTPGQNDAANLLKPALARGELRAIAATTWAEYKRHIEKDAALTRRFQPVKVAEPDRATAEDMLRAIVPTLEAHAKIRIADEAVRAAVALSARYIADRQLPDKAIAVLDTAVARVMLSRCEPHPSISLEEAMLARVRTRIEAFQREEEDTGQMCCLIDGARHDVGERAQRIEEKRAAVARERVILERIQSYDTCGTEFTDVAAARTLAVSQLMRITGEMALVPRLVDADVVASVVADWTGIPAGRLTQGDAAAITRLEGILAKRVIGQDQAIAQIASRVRSARAGLGDPHRPQGVFLLVGPSGVGKTETALALAEALNGSDRKLLTVNMSEYQEAHSVSGLKGAPAGYVGYGEGGALTEAVRRQPYSVLLLDEVEKAHPDVLELFYQVFDRGYMADAEGREIDFRQTTIVLTSNVGSALVMQACLNLPDERPASDGLLDLLRPALYKAFKPAFLGRMTVVPYYPLSDGVLVGIIRGRLGTLGQRLFQGYGLILNCGDDVTDWVLSRCKEADAGARDAIRVIEGNVAGALASFVMSEAAASAGDGEVSLAVNGNDELFCVYGDACSIDDENVDEVVHV